jgi:hypothetical protein
MLFHFHYWTPFTVHQRIGKYNGEYKYFNPPLTGMIFEKKTYYSELLK